MRGIRIDAPFFCTPNLCRVARLRRPQRQHWVVLRYDERSSFADQANSPINQRLGVPQHTASGDNGRPRARRHARIARPDNWATKLETMATVSHLIPSLPFANTTEFMNHPMKYAIAATPPPKKNTSIPDLNQCCFVNFDFSTPREKRQKAVRQTAIMNCS